MAILNVRKVTVFPVTPVANTIYVKQNAGTTFELGVTNSTGVLHTYDVINGFAKGNLIQGNGITLSGTLTNRLVGVGDITIASTGIAGSGVSGQVSFWGTANSIVGSANFLWDNTTNVLTAGNEVGIKRISDGLVTGKFRAINTLDFELRNIGGNNSYVQLLSGGEILFGRTSTEYWRFTAGGIFQSIGAQTIQTATGSLTIATAAGAGNIYLLPNTTGSVGIGTTSLAGTVSINVNATATMNFATQATATLVIGNSSGVSKVPTISGKGNTNGGLSLIGLSTDVPVSGFDMVFDVREQSNIDFTTMTSSAYKFQRFNTVLLNILRNGSIGIGTDPTSKLDVNGDTRIRTIINLGAVPTDVLVPSSTGIINKRTLAEFRTDIGAQPIGNYVTLDTAQTITGLKTISNSNFASFIINRTVSGNTAIEFQNAGVVQGYIGTDASFFGVTDSVVPIVNSPFRITRATGAVVSSSNYTGTGFIKTGGTALQFLKADGSVDSTVYENSLNKQNSMVVDGTGVKYPTVDAVNLQVNNVARTLASTGFVDPTDTFSLYKVDNNTLGINASIYGIVFKQKLRTPPFAPSNSIIYLTARTIPLSAIGLTGTGTAVKYVGYRESDDSIVFSDTSYIQSPSVAQLGVVMVKFSGGVTSFVDDDRHVLTIPSIAGYSNLETSASGLKAQMSITANPGSLSHGNSAGKLIGISVAWGTSNNDVLSINSAVTTSFTRLYPGNAFTDVPPPFVTVMDPTRYWNGTALTTISGSPNQATIQRLLLTTRGTFVWQYGEKVHSNLIAAQNNILQETFSIVLPEGTFAEVGRMAITVNCNDLASSSAQYYPTGGSGGGSGINSSSILWGSILGQIDDQLDLKGKLDAKVNITTAVNTTAPLQGGGDLSISRTLSILQAGTASDGYLSAVDWNIFNNKQSALTNAITGTGVNGQIAFWNGVNTQTSDASLTWNNTSKYQLITNTLDGVDYLPLILKNNSTIVNTSVTLRFDTSTITNGISGGKISVTRSNIVTIGGSEMTLHVSGNTANILEGLRISPLSTTTTGVGIGGITPTTTLDVNGTTKIRTVNNLGITSTEVLVPSATGIVSKRTIAEFKTDLGLGSATTGSGVSGQVAYWNGTNTQTGDPGFLFDVTSNVRSLTIGGAAYAGSHKVNVHVAGSGVDGGFYLNAARALTKFTSTANVLDIAKESSFTQLNLYTSGTISWSILSTGILQSSGAQTIQTSTGVLTLQPSGGSTTGINATQYLNLYSSGFIGIVRNTVTNGVVVLSGGNTTTDGGNINLHGSTHTLTPNAIHLRTGSTIQMSVDSSVVDILTNNLIARGGISNTPSLAGSLTIGPIATFTITSGGSGYVDGVYTNAVLTASGNTALGTFDVTVVGGVVTAMTLKHAGSRYIVGGTHFISNTALGGTGSGMLVTIDTVVRADIYLGSTGGSTIRLENPTNNLLAGDLIGKIYFSSRDASAGSSGDRASIEVASTSTGGGARFNFYASASSAQSSAQALPVSIIATGIQLINGTAALPSYSFITDTNTGIFSALPDVLSFSTAGVERWKIDPTGILSTAGSAAYAPLIVNRNSSSNTAIEFQNASTVLGYVGMATSVFGITSSVLSFSSAPFRVVPSNGDTLLNQLTVNSVPALATTATNFLTRGTTNIISSRTPAQVLTDIGAAAASHTHAATDIVSGTLASARLSGTYSISITGDAATVGGVGISQIAQSKVFASTNFNSEIGYSGLSTINASSNTPLGSAWYSLINTRHRGGITDGTSYGMQLTSGTTNYANRLFMRTQNETWTPWVELVNNNTTGTVNRASSIWVGTFAQYSSLAPHNPEYLYFITD